MSLVTITKHHTWMGRNGARSAEAMTLRENNRQWTVDMETNAQILDEIEKRLTILKQELNLVDQPEPQYLTSQSSSSSGSKPLRIEGKKNSKMSGKKEITKKKSKSTLK